MSSNDMRLEAPPHVDCFFDPATYSAQYIVSDPQTGHCAIIDPVLDFEPSSGAVETRNADAILHYISDRRLVADWILETHPHADHISAAPYLKRATGARTAIGGRIIEVQRHWKQQWPSLQPDGSQWDHLFTDGEEFVIGSASARVLSSPGHTPASVSYLIGDAAFVHDTLFQPDGGSARADFPGGSAKALWQSIQAILALPDHTRIFTGHDYQPGGRAPRWESSVAEQRTANLHVAGFDESTFVALREARDATLAAPRLLLQALQVNLCGGHLPELDGDRWQPLILPSD